MTANEFLALCLEHTIAPEIVLENEQIVEALQQRDDERVLVLLRESY